MDHSAEIGLLHTQRAALHYKCLLQARYNRRAYTHKTHDGKLTLLLTPEQQEEDARLLAAIEQLGGSECQRLIKRAGDAERESLDRAVSSFIDTMCVRGEGLRITHAAFARAFHDWAHVSDVYKPNRITYAARRAGLRSRPSHGQQYYLTIELKK